MALTGLASSGVSPTGRAIGYGVWGVVGSGWAEPGEAGCTRLLRHKGEGKFASFYQRKGMVYRARYSRLDARLTTLDRPANT